jgi:hypothetical protein
MSYLLGESITMGVACESVRGTPVVPSDFVPARTASDVIKVVEKTMIKETRGSKYGTYGTEITHTRGEGELEFNVKNRTIGYFLKSLLGSVSSALKGGESVVYNHTFSILATSPANPTLTLALAQQGFQHYEYNGVAITKLDIEAKLDEVVTAKVGFVSRDETEHADFTPSFNSSDHLFRNHDFKVRVATTLGGLSGATPQPLKEFKLSFANNGKANNVVNAITPDDVLSGVNEIGGSMKIDFTGKTMYDYYKSNTPLYMEVSMVNIGQLIGTASNPSMVVTLYKVSLTSYKADRPIDDIVSESIEFNAHYSVADSKAVQVVLTNEKANYN